MFTENERDYFERLLEAKFQNLHDKIDTVIELQRKTNGRVTKLEEDVDDLNIYKAESESSWKTWTKAATLGGGILGAILGYVANKLL